ncbi:hypothetical protein IFM89_022893 [Coptis chinensis]|uniref:Protein DETOXIFICATION n=1 Tax=Coptis chinensis TaxID=261450 RepID=A0A835H821_9MAGN|nr:hypothetical protein IFM89_022893 [Coptis chinensis]
MWKSKSLRNFSSMNFQGIWIGMISGVAIQTLVLVFMTWRTDWESQVEKASARLNRWLLPTSLESDETTNHE